MTTQSHLLTCQAMSDADLDAYIVECGEHFLKAHAEGDMAGAQKWLDLEVEAARSRSPEQVRRMEEDYFSYEGELARRAAFVRSLC
jgi:hypothetical protein